MSKYDKAITELNKIFNPKGIKFTDAGEGWKKYKEKIKKLNYPNKRKG
mgnify:CR=1 FL=1|tara:strand:+ start:392 stop:535 length:144 start_codon:yes stop_codon:yes gene_type:complete